MKRISAIFIATALLSGCGSPHYTVTGRYGLAPGDSVYLLGSGNTVLAAGVMDADTTFTLKGRIAAPELASLSDRYATVEPAMLFLEAGTIRIEPRNGSGYRVTGTRLNDRKLPDKAIDRDAVKQMACVDHQRQQKCIYRLKCAG